MQLFKLFSISKIQGKVCGDDGFPDNLKDLLIFTGAQIGEDIVPFQLWKSKKPIKAQALILRWFQTLLHQTGYNSFTAQ